MSRRLLVFSADPGGADVLIPVLRTLPERYEPLLFSKGSGTATFEQAALQPMTEGAMDLEALIAGGSISAVLTSASSLPDKDMTEKWLWRWAATHGIPSVAILDQWQCFAERFSGPSGTERLGFLPSAIAIMDDYTKNELRRLGIPDERLVVTGQPALEAFRHRVTNAKTVSPPFVGSIITFFSQPIRDLFGASLGYDEWTVFRDVMQALQPQELKVICKLHPKQRREDIPLVWRQDASITFVQSEYSNEQLLAASTCILGMGSIMLAHAVLAGIPTVSFGPASHGMSNQCAPVIQGAIPQLTDPLELKQYLYQLRDPGFRAEHLARQCSFPDHEGAAAKILALLEQVVA